METVVCIRCGETEEVPKESVPEGFKGTAKLVQEQIAIGSTVLAIGRLYDGLIYVCTACVKQGVRPF